MMFNSVNSPRSQTFFDFCSAAVGVPWVEERAGGQLKKGIPSSALGTYVDKCRQSSSVWSRVLDNFRTITLLHWTLILSTNFQICFLTIMHHDNTSWSSPLVWQLDSWRDEFNIITGKKRHQKCCQQKFLPTLQNQTVQHISPNHSQKVYSQYLPHSRVRKIETV